MATELEKATKGGKSLNDAIQALLPGIIKESKKVIFNGNGYSEEWQKEAGKRGLHNLRNSVDAYPEAIKRHPVTGQPEGYSDAPLIAGLTAALQDALRRIEALEGK